MSQSGKRVLGTPTDQDIDHNGVKIPGGVKLWPIGADTAKEEIYTRLKIEQPGPGYMHFPYGLPDDYYSGLVAESQVTKYVKGYLRHVWEKTETERNEPLDLEVYAYAAAIYAGVLRINWDRLEAALLATAGDLFVQAQAKQAEAAAAAAEPAPAEPPVQTSASPAPKKEGWLPRRTDWLARR
jgi:phage terminase large subunit GpA-like protein